MFHRHSVTTTAVATAATNTARTAHISAIFGTTG